MLCRAGTIALAPSDPNSRAFLACAEREEDVRAGPSYHGIQRWQHSQDYPHAFRELPSLPLMSSIWRPFRLRRGTRAGFATSTVISMLRHRSCRMYFSLIRLLTAVNRPKLCACCSFEHNDDVIGPFLHTNSTKSRVSSPCAIATECMYTVFLLICIFCIFTPTNDRRNVRG